MFTGYYVSPIKAKFNGVNGYEVAKGFGKEKTVAVAFKIADGFTPDAAYEAANDAAQLLNNGPGVVA